MKCTMNKSTYCIDNDDGVAFKDIENSEKPEAGKFRKILPQILASTAKNFLLLDLGLAVSFSTIVIPALRGTLTDRDPNETLSFTDVQASWFGSVIFICQPIGSILSGWVTDLVGRKRAMILVNIPHMIAWCMLHFASSLTELYIAAILLGLGVGFMEAPVVTYVGEICQPSIRGILTSCAGISVMIGFFLVYLLGTIVTWRTAALICLAVPLMTMIAICFVPETPLWLLSKGRIEEARKSLQWLRGWVSPKAVEKEFLDIQRYSENSSKCKSCEKAKVVCNHPPPGVLDKLKELKRQRTIKPFMLLIAMFAFSNLSGMTAMRPYMVQIFKAYDLPLDAGVATVIVGVMGILSNIALLGVLKFTGKRKIGLFSMAGAAICCLSNGFYASANLPSNISSFEENIGAVQTGAGVFPMIMFFGLAFFTNLGVAPVPWMLISEVFPFKSRGIATGLTAAINYLITFITTKTYLEIETSLGLRGAAWLYGGIGVVGFIFLFFTLPETERRTLEEIELHFSTKNNKLTNIKIKKGTGNKTEDNQQKDKQKTDSISVSLENESRGCTNRGFER